MCWSRDTICEEACAGILEQSMGARNWVGIGLSYRAARLHRLAEWVPWNRFLSSLKVKKYCLSEKYRLWLPVTKWSLAISRASTGRNASPGQASSAEVTLQGSPNSSLGRCLFLSGFIHKEMLQKETKVDRNGNSLSGRGRGNKHLTPLQLILGPNL
jgi:hypothetical protein